MTLIAHQQYFYQAAKDCGYFLVNGTQELVEAIATQLDEAGYQVHRIAESWKPNRLGRQYDWYIRIKNPDGSIPYYKDFTEFALKFRDSTKDDLKVEKERLAREFDLAQEQIEHLRFETNFAGVEKEDLQHQAQKLMNLLTEKEAYVRMVETDNDKLTNERNQLKSLNYALQGRIDSMENPNLDRLLSGEDEDTDEQATSFMQTLQTLFPTAYFLGDSLKFMETWRNPRSALTVLTAIVSGQEYGKPFQAAGAGWKEVTKVNNGHDESGRIYFCKDGEVYYVLVSIKENQERDAKYLKNQ